MIQIPFEHLEKMVRKNLFLPPEIKKQIIFQWSGFSQQKAQRIYDLVVVAYAIQLQAMEKALEQNPQFLADLMHASQKADWESLKAFERNEFRKSQAYSEDIIEELNTLT